MNEYEIEGIRLIAVGRSGKWQARVYETGEVIEQHYKTRKKMWDDLLHVAKIVGKERFTSDGFLTG